MINVLVVCLGNICRSPAGEGILANLAAQKGYNAKLDVASCGLGEWHVGELPDFRMRQASEQRGVILNSRAQQFKVSHFDTYDYILAVDQLVFDELLQLAKSEKAKAKVHLINDYSLHYRGQDVPDPYYGGDAGFGHVLDMLEESCNGFLTFLFEESNEIHPS